MLVNYLSHYSYVTLYYRNTFIELFNFNDNSFKPNIQYWVLNVTLVISEYGSLGCIPPPPLFLSTCFCEAARRLTTPFNGQRNKRVYFILDQH